MPFAGDQQFYCDWFNVGLPNPADSGDIEVQKYVCPAGIDPYQADLAALQANCVVPLPGIDFLLLDGNQVFQQDETAADGFLALEDIPSNTYGLVEQKPEEYGPARVFCQTTLADLPVSVLAEYPVSEGLGIEVQIDSDQIVSCVWFNIPVEEVGDIEIVKYACDTDPGEAVLESPEYLQDCELLNGIDFTLSSDAGSSTVQTGEPQGMAYWFGLPPSTYSITESVPEGYGEPVVYCGQRYSDVPAAPFIPEVIDASVELDLDSDMKITCIWINLPLEDGSITIYKHLCPPGYDIYAYGADPWFDCTGNGHGIGFWLNDANYQQTGDSLDSAVAWDGLAPGSYVVSEDVPPGTKTVFVLKCEGNSAPLIQNYPVSIGSTFQLYVESGDDIVCHWYNVPKAEHSTITVVKYACSTETFVSADYCQLYEGGAGFDLSKRHSNGSEWGHVERGYTNANGALVFGGLQNGTYQIDEIDGHWCYATADRTDEQGYLIVENHDVTVWVYNCGIELPKPKPHEYPNTGAGPSGALAMSATAPVVPSEAADVLDWRHWAGALDSRLTAPFALSGKPVRIEIEGIGVSATIETLEVVDGVFQEPTSAGQVAWYKDTSWLGSSGNIVMAGHLNYWGVPEGVFFALATVEPGSIVEVTADNGEVYRYEVTTVQLLPADAGSLETVTADTGGETLTLITCGGDWDPSSQHYVHRTVVQATRIA